jgi:hypothetical protein
MKKALSIIALCGLATMFFVDVVMSEPWKFGLIADTQWPSAAGADSLSGFKNPNSVAVDIINQVNREFISKGVKLVIAVGDVTDNGSNLALDTRVTYAQALYNAGIAFYPLRGNHESSYAAALEFKRIFPQTVNGANNNTPSDAFVYTDSSFTKPAAKSGTTFTIGSGFSSPAIMPGLSYSFTYNNATFVLLDQFTRPDSSSTTGTNAIDSQETWISGVLSGRAAGTHAFVFGHKGLITENHADILFSADEATGKPSDDTAGANAFIRTLAANRVHYYMGGHDHIHNRAMVCTSNDTSVNVQDIILASDSYKFYKPVNPSNDSKYDSTAFGHNRETPIAQDYARIGYYIVTVDSARVSVDYYSVASGQSGGVITTAPVLTGNWAWRETFGYSLNGREFPVAQGQSYTGVIDSNSGTVAKILSGVNTSTAMDSSSRHCTQLVGTGWSTGTAAGIASKILTLWGMANALGSSQAGTFGLSMSYAPPSSSADIVQGKFGLVTKTSDGTWINAVDGNYGGTKSFVLGPWRSSAVLGTYGVDTTTHAAWAVVNFAGDFGVASIVETSNSRTSAHRSVLGTSDLFVRGNRLVLPQGQTVKSVSVQLFTLNGKRVFQASTEKGYIDISNIKKEFGNAELLVKCASGTAVEIKRIFLF